ncbi:uncharacterized protein LOC106993567 isoform X2 [Macaca mulatta]
MQMTSKLEEPGRKAAIINKTKRKDEGTGPGVLAGGDQKNGVWRKAGICTNKKATRSPSRSSLLRRESRRKKEREQTPPHTPETVHKRERKTRARTHGDILRVMNMIIGQETREPFSAFNRTEELLGTACLRVWLREELLGDCSEDTQTSSKASYIQMRTEVGPEHGMLVT